jgi:phosphoribosyl 1,2-cyclic phosphate phosphodiesterase
LTHMGPDMDWGWLRANLPSGVEAGFDGMIVDTQ